VPLRRLAGDAEAQAMAVAAIVVLAMKAREE